MPKLEANELRRLAAAGRGRYTQMTTDNSDIELLLSGRIGSSSDTGQSLATDQWREEGPWLLLLLLPVAALAFRRGLVICLAFLLLPMTEPAQAFGWDDLWLNENQQGQQKLDEGLPQDAAELFEDPQWQAVSNYRSGNYAASAAVFAENDDADSLYNLGNALARSSEYASAIDAYDQALQLSPDDEDTRYNRDLVADLLQQQQQQQNEQQSGQQSDAESGGESQPSDDESQSGQESEEGSAGDSDNESQDGDPGRNDQETDQDDMQAMQEELQRAADEAEQQQGEDSEAQAMSQAQAEAMRRAQEQTQAMEQWLRRVDNDPGGLLRRKFRYQYQRQGKDQDGNNVWPDDEVEPW